MAIVDVALLVEQGPHTCRGPAGVDSRLHVAGAQV